MYLGCCLCSDKHKHNIVCVLMSNDSFLFYFSQKAADEPVCPLLISSTLYVHTHHHTSLKKYNTISFHIAKKISSFAMVQKL